ncbi:MAG TPA: efflux RND transporter periplasmic adaptor subunit [Vicinamibacterales bacterium]|nr:efflux RND transporter periplasmic adaptor subunit [Vicinamibacterales bacterium]
MPSHLRYAALLVVLPLLQSCSTPGAAGDAARGPGGSGRGGGDAVPVLTARVEQKSMPVTLPAVGTVEAVSSVDVRAQVTGQLSAIHFTEGQDVKKGQPLFSLDPRPFQAALKQAEAVLARDAATLRNTEAQEERIASLFQRGLIPRDQFESQQASKAAQEAVVAADRAAVENARLNLEYTEIVAPISGRTGALGVHVGDLVRANDAGALVVINQLTPAYVSFSVPGRHLADIRRFQASRPLAVTASPNGDASGPVERGVVSFIDNAVDPTTGTIRLKATFQNAVRQLWPGAFVRVTLDLTTDPAALVVPAPAVQVSQNGQYVYVVKPDQTVEMRTIELARQQGDEAVIASGLAAGEVVVTDGQLRLTPGAKVSERRGGER